MQKWCFILFLSCFLFSCEEKQPEDKTSDLDKDGSVETNLHVGKGPQFDTLVVTYNVWVKNQLYKRNVIVDSLPHLGYTREEADSTDENGNPAQVTVPKNYNLFVTVK
jgi:hypothetical protein